MRPGNCALTFGGSTTIIVKYFGALAQLGERQVRNLEVVSSILICSTMNVFAENRKGVFLFADYSYCLNF